MSNSLVHRVRASRVHVALGDSWQVEGALREPEGGGSAEVAGIRLMASGLPYPEWNCGDVYARDGDVASARSWYAERDVPWGLRVPAGLSWSPGGRLLVRQRCFGLEPSAFRPAPAPDGATIRAALSEDLDAVVHVDAGVFGDRPRRSRSWRACQLAAGADAGVVVLLALLDGDPVGVATGIRTGAVNASVGVAVRGGESAGVLGVEVLSKARRCGIGAALTSHLVSAAFADGATLAVVNPETPISGRVYSRLGFVETGGQDVYVEV